MQSYVVTPAAGKRLIAKALVKHPDIQTALASGTVVIVAGTTNGYVAEELLNHLGDGEAFDRGRFMRGITVPPAMPTTDMGRLPGEGAFPGDVVIEKGQWVPGKTIFDVADGLGEEDIIVKGANALDLKHRRAAVLIGHPQGGTVVAALRAVIGRRVRLLLPVGLEKRVEHDLDHLAALLNRPGATGPRLMPAPGEVFSELEAIHLLTGAAAHLIAAGGVCGAEGSVWLALDGDATTQAAGQALMDKVTAEPPFWTA